jgi:hypothetical protein
MQSTSAALLLLLPLGAVAGTAWPQTASCPAEQQQYSRLNRPLIIETDEERAVYTPEREERLTQVLHLFVVQQFGAQLARDSSPESVEHFLRCMQAGMPMYERIEEFSGNVPQVLRLADGATAVGYFIVRGGLGIPNVRNYFEVYQKQGDSWSIVGTAGAELGSATFFVYPISSGRPAEHWFILSGKKYGGTRGNLRLFVVAYDGMSVRTVWQSEDYPWTTIAEVQKGHVVLTGTSRDEVGLAFEFRKVLTVVPEGLHEGAMEKLPPQ